MLPSPCLVVLVGPSGAGKSTWALAHFAPEQVVSSDELRAIVGESDEDLAASADAFALLEEIVRLRIGRSLTTVVDTLGLDPDRPVGMDRFGARRTDWRPRASCSRRRLPSAVPAIAHGTRSCPNASSPSRCAR